MAHVIIFTDRAPKRRAKDLTNLQYTHFAGAGKIASMIREKGLTAIIVPNCLNLSFAGMKQIIENNKKDLLWVGISTTLMGMQVTDDDIKTYETLWRDTTELTIDIDFLIQKIKQETREQLPWNNRVLGRISHYLESSHQVPLIIGGAYSTSVDTTGALVHRNMHVVHGYAEQYVRELTDNLIKDKTTEVPYIVSNDHYDDYEFKQSRIQWTDTDFIEPDDWLTVEVARGCAFNCSYCNYPKRGKFEAYKDPKVLRNELIENYEKFGVTKFLLVDDLYNDTKEKVRRLYDECWSKLPFAPEWVSFMRLDMLWADPESAEIIKASGARYGQFGIETLHDRAGTKVGKGLGKKRIIETLESLNKIWGTDVLIGASMISGLPHEPLESIEQTIEWTSTTDLLHGTFWTPMLMIPPQEGPIGMTGLKNKIDSDFEKFGITWLNDRDWINSVGVTRQQTVDAVKKFHPKNPWQGRFNYSVYADLRSNGFTHEQIANMKNGSISDADFQRSMEISRQKINKRLEKILQLQC